MISASKSRIHHPSECKGKPTWFSKKNLYFRTIASITKLACLFEAQCSLLTSWACFARKRLEAQILDTLRKRLVLLRSFGLPYSIKDTLAELFTKLDRKRQIRLNSKKFGFGSWCKTFLRQYSRECSCSISSPQLAKEKQHWVPAALIHASYNSKVSSGSSILENQLNNVSAITYASYLLSVGTFPVAGLAKAAGKTHTGKEKIPLLNIFLSSWTWDHSPGTMYRS